MIRALVRPLHVAIALAATVATGHAVAQPTTITTNPTAIAANTQVAVTWTFPSSPPIVSFANPSVAGGDAYFLSAQLNAPTPAITFLVIAANLGPAPISIEITTGLGMATWTGSIAVNPPNPSFGYVHLAPAIPPSGIVISANPSLSIASFVQPYNGNQAYVCRVFNPALNAEVLLTTTNSVIDNRASFSGNVPLAPGMQTLFEVVVDANCPGCDGTVFAYSVDVNAGPSTPTLSVQYPLGITGPYASAPIGRET